ncbi:hypothetical protein [Rufibacter sp. XAAS-G3-1]|nr:hypothetical protein [Rufibacter sp. XAAS-G3-1]
MKRVSRLAGNDQQDGGTSDYKIGPQKKQKALDSIETKAFMLLC